MKEFAMQSIAIIAVLISIIVAGAVSRRIRGTVITLPMVYTVLGILIGSLVLDILKLDLEDAVVEIIAEITLVVVLATDASRINVRSMFTDHNLPLRLLAIGLPLTIIGGMITAALLFTDLGIWEAAILAVILCPTDASLGQSVVSNPKVPVRIRQALNIESGLNDGIAMPFLFLAVALATSSARYQGPGAFLFESLIMMGLGILVGLITGYLGAKFIQWGRKSGWMSRGYQKITTLALILLTYALAELIGGNGFIAAFCFGLANGNTESDPEREELYDYSELELTVLMLLTFVLFGAVMLPPAIENFDPRYLIFAVLSLTAIRMVPVAIAMIGEKVRPVTTLFMGWFGPRGVASMLYVFLILEEDSLLGLDLIYGVVMITVLISIFAHGITAAPAANRYGGRMDELDQKETAVVESKPVPEMPLRATGQK
jgi:NhaP-type Na+/H+ or K+/H+ antiporter